MKKPRYKKMPKQLKRYWKMQDGVVLREGISIGILVGGLLAAAFWIASL